MFLTMNFSKEQVIEDICNYYKWKYEENTVSYDGENWIISGDEKTNQIIKEELLEMINYSSK